MKNLHLMRREYDNGTLHKRDMKKNPIEMYTGWLNEAIEAGIDEPNAMVLATATTEGKPSARVVLLKVTDRFIFFTNYQSNKERSCLQSTSSIGVRLASNGQTGTLKEELNAYRAQSDDTIGCVRQCA